MTGPKLPGWVTNSRTAAAALKAADLAHDRAMTACSGMLLADKIKAVAAARAAREAAYRAVVP